MRSLETTETLESTRYLSPRQAIQERHMMSPHVVVVIIIILFLFHCKPKRNKSTNRLNNSPHDKGGDSFSDSHKKWKKYILRTKTRRRTKNQYSGEVSLPLIDTWGQTSPHPS